MTIVGVAPEGFAGTIDARCAGDLRAPGHGAHGAAARELGRVQRTQRSLALRVGAARARASPVSGPNSWPMRGSPRYARRGVPAAARRHGDGGPHGLSWPGAPCSTTGARGRNSGRDEAQLVLVVLFAVTGSGVGDRGGQRGEPPAGPRGRPRAGDRRAAVAGRLVVAAGPAAADRGRGAGRSGRNRALSR